MKERVGVSTILFRILEILVKHSDANHPITQDQIVQYIVESNDIEPDRRTIAHGMEILQAYGVKITRTDKGCYLEERVFRLGEIVYFISIIQASRVIDASSARELGNRLESFVPEFESCWNSGITLLPNRSRNANLFDNIELIRQAIKQNRQIGFTYCHYGTDKKLHKCKRHTVSSLRRLNNHLRPYLISYDSELLAIRILRPDKMTAISMKCECRTVCAHMSYREQELIQGKINVESPYMYVGETDLVEFVAAKEMMDHIIDWFRTDIVVVEEEKNVRVSLHANLRSMEYWALQFLKYVEIIKGINI